MQDQEKEINSILNKLGEETVKETPPAVDLSKIYPKKKRSYTQLSHFSSFLPKGLKAKVAIQAIKEGRNIYDVLTDALLLYFKTRRG